MNPPAKLSALIDALEFQSDEHETLYDRKTGRVVSVEHSVLRAVEEGDEELLRNLPDWQKEEVGIAEDMVNDTGGRFINPPDKFDFHEYRQMERFIGTVESERDSEQLWRAIKGKGAFRYFKDTASRLGLLEEWYRYRDEAMKEFVLDWAEAHEVAVDDDTKGHRPG
jgi:hypothetical protein